MTGTLSSFRVFQGALWSLLLLLPACGHFGIKGGESGPEGGDSVQLQARDSGADPGAEKPYAPEKTYPNVDLNKELLYNLLVGEIAIQRGDFKTATETLAQAARETKDPRLAERAARSALEAGLLDQALAAAQAWVELDPDDKMAKEVTALVLVEKGQTAQAEALFGELLDKDEAHRGTLYRRIADMLGRRDNSAAGIALMQVLADRHPDTPEGYYALAYLADRAKRSDLVIEALDKALALRPDWEDAARAKIAHLAANKDTKAVTEFADQYLVRNPDSRRLRLNYARYLVEQNENDKALQQFEALLKTETDNADALFAAGYLSFQLKRYEQAEKHFLANLRLRPGHMQTRLYLGQLAAEQKKYKDARRWYDSINKTQDKQYFESRVLLAGVIAKTEGIDVALTHLDGIEAQDEEQYVRVTLTKELVLREGKELQRAKSVLDDAVVRYPENTELIYARGLLAAQLQLIDIHEKDMRKLLKKDPKNAHALNALGYTLADSTTRFDEAHELIQQALSIRPNDPFILDSMGWVQYRMGNHDLAIEYLEKALAKREDAEIAAHLGEVLWTSGARDRAQKIWADALKRHPKNDVLRGTIEKLNP